MELDPHRPTRRHLAQRSRRQGCRRGRAHGERGATLVEFALTAPFLFLLLLGIIEVGLIATSQHMLSSASREGVRYGMALGIDDGLAQYLDCDGIEAQARRMLTLGTVRNADVTIDYLDEDGNEFTPPRTCPSPGEVGQGDRVRVTVEVRYHSLLPLPFGPFDLDAEHTRTIGGR